MDDQSSAIDLDRTDYRPLYLQICDQFRARIESDLWPAGYRLLASDVLAADLGVARGTIRHAISHLVDEGLLVKVHGRGTFVTERRSGREHVDLEPISTGQHMARAGVEFRTEVLEMSIQGGRPRVGPFPGGRVVKINRVRHLTEGPDAILQTELAIDLVPQVATLKPSDLESQSLRQFLKESFGLTAIRGRRMYTAIHASEYSARLLKVPVGSPLLAFEEFHFDSIGGCFEYTRGHIRTDHHPVAIDL